MAVSTPSPGLGPHLPLLHKGDLTECPLVATPSSPAPVPLPQLHGHYVPVVCAPGVTQPGQVESSPLMTVPSCGPHTLDIRPSLPGLAEPALWALHASRTGFIDADP